MKSRGYRSGTRHRYAQGFRKRGMPKPSTYTTVYRKGQFVDIVANPAIHRGMPYKVYHGMTGRIFNVDPRSVGVLLSRRAGNRFVEKRVVVRVEHVRPSRCNEAFLARRAENDRARAEAAQRGESPGPQRRAPQGPRRAFLVSTENNEPVEIKHEQYFEVY